MKLKVILLFLIILFLSSSLDNRVFSNFKFGDSIQFIIENEKYTFLKRKDIDLLNYVSLSYIIYDTDEIKDDTLFAKILKYSKTPKVINYQFFNNKLMKIHHPVMEKVDRSEVLFYIKNIFNFFKKNKINITGKIKNEKIQTFSKFSYYLEELKPYQFMILRYNFEIYIIDFSFFKKEELNNNKKYYYYYVFVDIYDKELFNKYKKYKFNLVGKLKFRNIEFLSSENDVKLREKLKLEESGYASKDMRVLEYSSISLFKEKFKVLYLFYKDMLCGGGYVSDRKFFKSNSDILDTSINDMINLMKKIFKLLKNKYKTIKIDYIISNYLGEPLELNNSKEFFEKLQTIFQSNPPNLRRASIIFTIDERFEISVVILLDTFFKYILAIFYKFIPLTNLIDEEENKVKEKEEENL